MENGSVTLIMPHRLRHSNFRANPHAAYLFFDGGSGYRGTRLRRRTRPEEQDKKEGPRFLRFVEVAKVLPLIGSGVGEKEI